MDVWRKGGRAGAGGGGGVEETRWPAISKVAESAGRWRIWRRAVVEVGVVDGAMEEETLERSEQVQG